WSSEGRYMRYISGLIDGVMQCLSTIW
ncbi:unnamed protein product, partial [Rotaria sordida]